MLKLIYGKSGTGKSFKLYNDIDSVMCLMIY